MSDTEHRDRGSESESLPSPEPSSESDRVWATVPLYPATAHFHTSDECFHIADDRTREWSRAYLESIGMEVCQGCTGEQHAAIAGEYEPLAKRLREFAAEGGTLGEEWEPPSQPGVSESASASESSASSVRGGASREAGSDGG